MFARADETTQPNKRFGRAINTDTKMPRNYDDDCGVLFFSMRYRKARERFLTLQGSASNLTRCVVRVVFNETESNQGQPEWQSGTELQFRLLNLLSPSARTRASPPPLRLIRAIRYFMPHLSRARGSRSVRQAALKINVSVIN